MRISFVLIALLASIAGYSQSLLDLQSQLKSAKTDTATLSILNELTYYYIYEDNDSARFYNVKSFKFSEEKKITHHNFDAYYWKALLLKIDKDYNIAKFTALEAETVAQAMNNKRNQVRAKLLMGRIFEAEGNNKAGIKNYLEGLLIAEKSNDKKGMLSAKKYLGLYFKSQNEITSSLKYFIAAMQLADEIKDSNSIFMCAINLGSLYEYSNDNEKALTFYQRALKINENDNDPNGRAICAFKIGRLYIKLNKTDSAKIFLNETMEIHKERNDELGLILDYAFIAGTYNKEGNYKKSDEAYAKALELTLKHNDSLKTVRIYTYMARTQMDRGNYKQALHYFNLCLNNAPYNYAISGYASNYGHIALSHEKLGNYKQAYKYQKLHKLFSDSSVNSNDTKRQTELKLGYEFDQIQEKLIAEAEANELKNKVKIEQQEQQQNFLLIGLTLISLMLILAYRSFRMKKKANHKLKEQKDEIEHQKILVDQKNLEISDSINYALQIQTASLPKDNELSNYFAKNGLFYKPKDVVSGDFYWAAGKDNFSLIAIADCTGHGVPGAITSMIGSMLLNEIYHVKNIIQPNEILTELNRLVKLTLRQESGSLSRDGMDIAICHWNKLTNKLLYAGANRVLYILRKDELLVYKPTKVSIGGHSALIQHYDINEIQLEAGDTVVMTSDGYVDQFGGEKDKKFTSKKFRNTLIKNAHLSLQQQSEILKKRFEEWKGDNEQTDDVLVFMFRV
jgi:serine phosphatase RsbU (regulator of sigma subunit)/lipopolysaccharide biosynthesis regulator YciM